MVVVLPLQVAGPANPKRFINDEGSIVQDRLNDGAILNG